VDHEWLATENQHQTSSGGEQGEKTQQGSQNTMR